MNIALVYSDSNRFWTVGSFILKELSKQDEINIVCHPQIPEDLGILEEQCGLNIDLIIVIDCSVHYKVHHHSGKLGKARVVFWVSDMHRQDWSSWRLQMIKEFHYDHIFYAQKSFKQMILDCGYTESEVTFLPHAVDTDVFKPMSWIEKRYDMGFVGYSNDRRKKAVDVLKQYVNFRHFDSIWAWAACRALNEMKIGFNCSVEDSDICNMRVFETLACGIPLLTNYVPNMGIEDLFGNDYENKMLTYSNEQEMIEKAVRLIACSDLRKQLAENGLKHIKTYHTYRNRINTILGIMGFELLKNY
jgi:spore maturation protein CgeB